MAHICGARAFSLSRLRQQASDFNARKRARQSVPHIFCVCYSAWQLTDRRVYGTVIARGAQHHLVCVAALSPSRTHSREPQEARKHTHKPRFDRWMALTSTSRQSAHGKAQTDTLITDTRSRKSDSFPRVTNSRKEAEHSTISASFPRKLTSRGYRLCLDLCVLSILKASVIHKTINNS